MPDTPRVTFRNTLSSAVSRLYSVISRCLRIRYEFRFDEFVRIARNIIAPLIPLI